MHQAGAPRLVNRSRERSLNMDVLIYLIPVALVLGLVALLAFMWSLKSGQFEDMEGAANRILFDDDDMPVEPSAPAKPAHDEPKD